MQAGVTDGVPVFEGTLPVRPSRTSSRTYAEPRRKRLQTQFRTMSFEGPDGALAGQKPTSGYAKPTRPRCKRSSSVEQRADGVGFEPTRPLRAYGISSAAPSTELGDPSRRNCAERQYHVA
jgi:hypothetical protein